MQCTNQNEISPFLIENILPPWNITTFSYNYATTTSNSPIVHAILDPPDLDQLNSWISRSTFYDYWLVRLDASTVEEGDYLVDLDLDSNLFLFGPGISESGDRNWVSVTEAYRIKVI